MAQKNQAIWVGLSFLVLGLIIGVFISSGSFTNEAGEEEPEKLSKAELEKQVLDYMEEVEPIAVNIDDDPIFGDVNAPVTIIEFSNFQCHYCLEFHTNVFPRIKENYIDEGLVKFVYRDYPPTSYPQGRITAEAAECVDELSDDATYFAMHDSIFGNIANWSQQSDADQVLAGLAEELGVDIKSCLSNGLTKEEVENDYLAGRGYGVGGTPTFYINGKPIVGAHDYEVFETALNYELESLGQ